MPKYSTPTGLSLSQLLLFLMALLMLGHPLNAQMTCTFSFSTAIDTYADKSQSKMVIEDFTSDGIPDLACIESNNPSPIFKVAILKGAPTGSFSTVASYTYGNNLPDIASADFNADGKKDLIISGDNGNDILLLLGNGNGSFQPALTYTTFAAPYGVAAADFNSDGKPDVIVTYYGYYGGFDLFLGTGTGSLLAAPISFTSGTYPLKVIAKDFNSDNNMDLAILSYAYPGDVSIYLGTGTGSFTPGGVCAPIMMGAAMESNDFNGDGILDLAVSQTGSGITMFFGSGNGNFVAAPPTTGISPATMVSADFNVDGKVDLAACFGGVRPVIYLGDGNGNFPDTIPFSSSARYGPVLSTDFNADGRPDLAVGYFYTTNKVTVFMNTAGNFPQISISASNSLICAGETLSLQVTGAASYTWNPGGIVSSGGFYPAPVLSGSCTVMGMDTLTGCVNKSAFFYTVDICTGLDHLDIDNAKPWVYPNPTNGKITIRTSMAAKLTVFDLLGRSLMTSVLPTGESYIDLNFCPAGIYTIRITSDSGFTKESKLVKVD